MPYCCQYSSSEAVSFLSLNVYGLPVRSTGAGTGFSGSLNVLGTGMGFPSESPSDKSRSIIRNISIKLLELLQSIPLSIPTKKKQSPE